ncbi:MAG: sigma-70 family RNA polymerase sigma factor [Anaerolineales bacterium]
MKPKQNTLDQVENLPLDLSDEEQLALAQLIELSKEQGSLSYEDIMTQVPEAEEMLPVIDSLFDALQVAGIEITENGKVPTELEKIASKVETSDSEDSASLEANPENSALEAIDAGDSVGLYLSQVGLVPLLTRSEEVELAKRIERGRVCRDELAHGPVSEKKRKELETYIEDGMAAREHLIMANSRLVISVAKKYNNRGVPLLDLIQEGHVGLMRAVKKFDYRRGHKFSTYATWWIRQAITRLIADHGRTIRVPVHMGDRINRMLRSRHQLMQELGREPNEVELAAHLETTPKSVEDMLRVAQRPISLEKPTDYDSDSVMADFIEDEESPAPEELTQQELLGERVQELLETLPPREALVVRLRYGLPTGEVHTLKQIGLKLGITRERVRQIENQALRRLRHPSLQSELIDYVRA